MVNTDKLLTPGDYKVLDPAQQETLCKEILAEVASGQFKPAGESSREHWNEVWAANTLDVPPYIFRPGRVLRVNGQFVRPRDPWFELNWYKQFRAKVLRTYFRDVFPLYEFGCGNGWNLAAAHQLYPEKSLVGLDWAEAAVDRLPRDIHGRVFDFFHPDYDLKLVPGSGVLTVGALEQTGTAWEPFLEYLLANRPAVVVHVEPIVEWYDPTNPVDATAIAYHLARNYWRGFPAKLQELAMQGTVEILEQKRSYFGSKYIEGYSVLAWRPL